MPMLEAEPSEHLLMVSITLLIDLYSPPIIMVTALRLISSALSLPPLTLATIAVGQLVDWLMKGAIFAMGKRKLVVLVPLPLVELAKPFVKVTTELLEGLIPETCPDMEMLVKQF